MKSYTESTCRPIAYLSFGLVLLLAFSGVGRAGIIMPTLESSSDVVSDYSTTPAGLTDNAELFDSAGAAQTVNNGDTLAKAQTTFSEWEVGGHESGWIGAHDPQVPTFVWDVGTDTQLTHLILWKYGNDAGSAAHAAKDFELRFNTAAQGSATFSGSTTSIVLGLPTVATSTTLPTGQVAQAPDTFALGGVTGVTARYIEMRVLTNHSGNAAYNVGFNELRFNSDPIPEPSTFGLAALGLLSLGLVGWRRRKRG